MKTIITTLILALSPTLYAEGPILECDASQQVQIAGHPGFSTVGSAKIHQPVTDKIQVTDVNGSLQVKTYLRADGLFFLVLIDKDLNTSSTSSGNASAQKPGISLSLSGERVSNFVSCEVI